MSEHALNRCKCGATPYGPRIMRGTLKKDGYVYYTIWCKENGCGDSTYTEHPTESRVVAAWNAKNNGPVIPECVRKELKENRARIVELETELEVLRKNLRRC